MDITSIEKFLSSHPKKENAVNVHFKDRTTVTGIFVVTRDYEELKAKNFWRIVNIKNLLNWQKSKDENITRLYSGATFTRLSNAAK